MAGPRWVAIVALPLWLGVARADELPPTEAVFTVGGQHRLRYELTTPAGTGEEPAAAEHALLLRNLLRIGARPSPYLRALVEFGAHFSVGPEERRAPPDRDLLDVQQMFVEAAAVLPGATLRLRVGRQELTLGTSRWVSARDGTNVRRSFDLARAFFAGVGFQGQIFFGVLPELRSGVFDDAPDFDERFWGSYWSIELAKPALALNWYVLGRRRDEATYGVLSGSEVRHTLGVQASGATEWGFSYIGHALYQFGGLGSARVRAWGFAGGLWQALSALPGLRVGFRFEALSGDHEPSDRRVTTFDPLFPNLSFFGALSRLHPTNLLDLHPLLRWETGALDVPLSAEVGCAFLWRQAIEDAVYQPPGVPLASPGPSAPRYTGALATLAVVAHVEPLELGAELSRLLPGAALAHSEAGGATYLGVTLSIRYGERD